MGPESNSLSDGSLGRELIQEGSLVYEHQCDFGGGGGGGCVGKDKMQLYYNHVMRIQE